jgi:hypothetical protein
MARNAIQAHTRQGVPMSVTIAQHSQRGKDLALLSNNRLEVQVGCVDCIFQSRSIPLGTHQLMDPP